MHRSIHSQFPSIGIERITSVIETREFDEILEIAVGASSPCLILVRHIQTVKNGRLAIYPPTGVPVLGSIPWAGRPRGSHELYVKGEYTKKLTW